jgi:hypothetical protein
VARRVFGRITSTVDGSTVEDALVEAWDSDIGGDDFMGCDVTSNDGRYSICYAGGHWDPAPHRVTTWRPDIYVRVYLKNSVGSWIRVGTSSTHSNHKLRNDLRIDLVVTPPNPYARTVRGYITWQDTGDPAEGLLVLARDADWGILGGSGGATDSGVSGGVAFGPSSELMGTAITNQQGFYQIPYEAKHWDSGYPHGWTKWRPDIFIVVRGDDESGNSYKLYKSPVHSNVPHREGVRIDARVRRVQEVAGEYWEEHTALVALTRALAEGEIESADIPQETLRLVAKRELESVERTVERATNKQKGS